MWFSAAILFRDRLTKGIEVQTPKLRLPKRVRSVVREMEEGRDLCEEFAKYVFSAEDDPTKIHYGHILTFLGERRLSGVPKKQIRKEMEILLKFLGRLWEAFGKQGNPLRGENPAEDLDWLDDWHEEVVVLIEAENEEKAWEKAEALGKRWADEYNREGGNGLKREFVGVLTVQEIIDELGDEAEIFSRFLTTKEAKRLLRQYRIKAQ